MVQSFKIEAVRPTAIAMLLAIAAGCGLLAFPVAMLAAAQPLVAWCAAVTCVGIGLLFAWFALAQSWSSVTITDRQVELSLPLYGRTIAIDEIIVGSQAKVNLSNGDKFRLAWRLNGLSVPGYSLGWFRTQGSDKVLAALTRPDAVTWSTRGGYAVLLSVEDADAFLMALNRAFSRE